MTVPRAAQTATDGTIEGRVLNARNDEYLENARVTVEGTSLEAFTDSTGQYRLTNVPPGAARVRVFFTGLAVQSAALNVAAGGTVRRDFTLDGADRPGANRDSSVVKLSEFLVTASKEMEGAAIAINEQRFAPNIKTVVSADEFGSITDGNVSEFLKFLPGMALNSVGGEGRSVMLNGAPNDYVPVTLGGFSMASAAGSSTSRRFEFDQISLNNISRIEILQSPTPESPGAALAGSINMVPRSAFERSRPQFNGSVYVMMKDNARELHKTPGPMRDMMRRVVPGFDFSYIVPVNERFGFTLTGGNSTLVTPLDFVQNTWRGTGDGTSHTHRDQSRSFSGHADWSALPEPVSSAQRRKNQQAFLCRTDRRLQAYPKRPAVVWIPICLVGQAVCLPLPHFPADARVARQFFAHVHAW